jgi:4'-phosphopantetheinyl transferase
LESLLSSEEAARARRFHFERHRREHIAAHAIKRLLLSAIEPTVRPLDWRFRPGVNGKPEVENSPLLHFNLTHCDGLVACAATRDFPIGLDAEALRPDPPEDLLDVCLSPAERAGLRQLLPAARSERFYALWTLKEAWAKATGDGLSQRFDQCSFQLSDPPTVAFGSMVRDDPGRWQFRGWRPLPTHVLGLAWRGPLARIEWRLLDPAAINAG